VQRTSKEGKKKRVISWGESEEAGKKNYRPWRGGGRMRSPACIREGIPALAKRGEAQRKSGARKRRGRGKPIFFKSEGHFQTRTPDQERGWLEGGTAAFSFQKEKGANNP